MKTSQRTQMQAWGITLLRLVAGILFLGAAAQNLFHEAFGQQSGSIFVVVGSLVELLCGAALVVGLFTRWVCVPLVLLMLADILVNHPPQGFFVGDAGFEHALLRLAVSAALALAGPGKVALDNIVAIRRGSKQA